MLICNPDQNSSNVFITCKHWLDIFNFEKRSIHVRGEKNVVKLQYFLTRNGKIKNVTGNMLYLENHYFAFQILLVPAIERFENHESPLFSDHKLISNDVVGYRSFSEKEKIINIQLATVKCPRETS